MSVAAVECRRGAAEPLCPHRARPLLGVAGSSFALAGIAMVITGLSQFRTARLCTALMIGMVGLSIVADSTGAYRRTPLSKAPSTSVRQ